MPRSSGIGSSSDPSTLHASTALEPSRSSPRTNASEAPSPSSAMSTTSRLCCASARTGTPPKHWSEREASTAAASCVDAAVVKNSFERTSRAVSVVLLASRLASTGAHSGPSPLAPRLRVVSGDDLRSATGSSESIVCCSVPSSVSRLHATSSTARDGDASSRLMSAHEASTASSFSRSESARSGAPLRCCSARNSATPPRSRRPLASSASEVSAGAERSASTSSAAPLPPRWLPDPHRVARAGSALSAVRSAEAA